MSLEQPFERRAAGNSVHRSRRERIATALFVCGIFASAPVLTHPWYDAKIDAAIYIATAQSMLVGDGYAYLGIPFRVRPPGFAALIAPVIAQSGVDFAALNRLVMLFGALGVVLLFSFARPRLGWIAAALCALAVWTNPAYQRLCNQIMSDVPGSSLLLLCLVVERWARRVPSLRRDVVVGLCIGLTGTVRSLAILLVPAILAARLLAGRAAAPRRAAAARGPLLFAAVALLVLLPWGIRNRVVEVPAPADQTRLYSYGTAMWHRDPGDPDSPRRSIGEILSGAPLRAHQIASVLGSRMIQDLKGKQPPSAELDPLHAVAGLVLIGSSLVVLVRRRETAEIFVAAALPLALFYYGFGSRLLLPVYVLALPATVEIFRELLRRAAGARAAAFLVPAALIGLIALDFRPRVGWEEIEGRHEAFAARAAAISAQIEPDTRLGSLVGFQYGVYLQRPVYSLKQTLQRAGRIDAADAVIDKYRLDAIVLTPTDSAERAFVPYFERHYGPGAGVGDARLWHVRPRGAAAPRASEPRPPAAPR